MFFCKSKKKKFNPRIKILNRGLNIFLIFFCFCSVIFRKARRKERDGGDSSHSDTKLYLEESVLERQLPDADLRQLVDLPAGLDYNEWLASHSKQEISKKTK